MTLTITLFNRAGALLASGPVTLLADYRPADHLVWLDIQGEDESLESALQGLQLNPLAVRDSRRQRHPPKFEAFNEQLFMIVQELTEGGCHPCIERRPLALFASDRYLVTRHLLESPAVQHCRERLAQDAKLPPRGMGQLVYWLLRNIADRFTPPLFEVEERLGEIEDEIFESSGDALLSELIGFASQLKKAHRAFVYQRDAIAELQRFGHDQDRPLTLDGHEMNDLHDHFKRLANLADLSQELATDLVNGFLSLNAYRMNTIVKVLTIVTAIFLPLNLVAGIYGMNFANMPELQWRYGYFMALGLMLGIVVCAVLLLRRKRWL